MLGPQRDQKSSKKRRKISKKLEKPQTRRDPGIQKNDLQKPAGQSYLEPTASLTPLLITCKELLQPALVLRTCDATCSAHDIERGGQQLA